MTPDYPPLITKVINLFLQINRNQYHDNYQSNKKTIRVTTRINSREQFCMGIGIDGMWYISILEIEPNTFSLGINYDSNTNEKYFIFDEEFIDVYTDMGSTGLILRYGKIPFKIPKEIEKVNFSFKKEKVVVS